MKERPILFSGTMVRAILDGRKTQTRRVMKPQPEWVTPDGVMCWNKSCAMVKAHKGPYGFPGDRLWVRETWSDVNSPFGPAICYRADGSYMAWEDFSKTFGPDYGAGPSMDYDAYPGDYLMWWEDLLNRDQHKEEGYRWKSPYHMPRWASRIMLEVKGVRVERLQDIGQGSACAEGCPPLNEPIEWFHGLWDTINGKTYPWSSNPFVWVIEFKRIEGGVS